MRRSTPARRLAASASPKTASPRRLMLSWSPFRVSCFSVLSRDRSLASMMRWPISPLRAARAIGTTMNGKSGANTAAVRSKSRRMPVKKAGGVEPSSRSACAATVKSSGRSTRSTKPSANWGPSGSLRRSASRLELACGRLCNCWARFSQERTCATESSASPFAPLTPVALFGDVDPVVTVTGISRG
ncbi:MAG: Uncharacterised protein [Cellulomonadaceae bacterium TMED98]|nr:MAG: Uncharacterised protein [Cellulomonadaceae bacterium TMED98]